MWTVGVARRSRPGSPGRLLHPATRRATGVRWSAAHFRAWRAATVEPRRDAPAGARRGPPSPTDEASTLASGARPRRPDFPGFRPPLMTVSRVEGGAKPPGLVHFRIPG